jgi:hypothetical protein
MRPIFIFGVAAVSAACVSSAALAHDVDYDGAPGYTAAVAYGPALAYGDEQDRDDHSHDDHGRYRDGEHDHHRNQDH